MPDPRQTPKSKPSFASQKPDFPVPSYQAMCNERNEIKTAYSSKHLSFTEGKEHFGYTVTEAREKSPLSNTSIQEVSVMLNQQKGTAGVGLVSSDRSFNGSGITSAITALNNGAVFYTESSMLEEFLGLQPAVMIDITKAAAQAGMTAAGIRRTQQDIAKDGEVTRPEQTRILTMLAKAKGLAGIK